MVIVGSCGKQKTRHAGRVLVETHGMRDSYPTGMRDIGRRAREVIPAAMRALERTWVKGRNENIMGRTLPAFLSQRNRKRGPTREGSGHARKGITPPE
jgi:hypothetical protein